MSLPLRKFSEGMYLTSDCTCVQEKKQLIIIFEVQYYIKKFTFANLNLYILSMLNTKFAYAHGPWKSILVFLQV
jgi:hypothetical protein